MQWLQSAIVISGAALALVACGGAATTPHAAPVPSASSEQSAPVPPRTNGRLEPAVIQKIVRASFGVFRKCYEAGLGRDPNLHGRVATRFVIERDGSVSVAMRDTAPPLASPGADDVQLPDAAVASCIASGFKALKFPEPDGGIVTVVYPIVFNPRD